MTPPGATVAAASPPSPSPSARTDPRRRDTSRPVRARDAAAGTARDRRAVDRMAGELLALQAELRRAADAATLHDATVRGIARLSGAASAMLVVRGAAGWRAVAATPARTVDRRAPMVRTVERAFGDPSARDARIADALGRSADCVLIVEADGSAAVLVFAERVPEECEATCGAVLEAHADALCALRGPVRRMVGALATRPVAIAAACGVAGLLAVPVPLTVLAEAEVVGRAPAVVASPIEGVVAELLVEPQEVVAAGDALVRLDDTLARGARDLSEREFTVAEARLARATGSAAREDRAALPVLIAERELAAVRLANAEARLARTLVRSPRAGTVLIDDPDAWAGRPVRLGERILRVVDPADVEVAVRIAPADMIDLPVGGRVAVHIDATPLAPLAGTLRRVASTTAERPDGTLAYDGRVALGDGHTPPRLGARGIARLSGERVPLLYLVLRRPLAMLRRVTGR